MGPIVVSLGVALIVVDLTSANVNLAPIVEDLAITSYLHTEDGARDGSILYGSECAEF
ncbi:hypothetical protein [Nocardia salmonicida]|uniref:hypothetical protein n=1 Tax=Nocardia salmonicida TaxID=53431 RepID=UPI003CEB90C8